MTVSLTISSSRGGGSYNDALQGGSNGIDFGQPSNGTYSPLIDQASNTGSRQLHIRHDAVFDPITDLKTYIQQYSGTYGGADSAANDYSTLIAKGNASNSSNANNDDGLASGLHVEMDQDVNTVNQFSPSRIFTGGGAGDFVAIYGDGGTDGIDLSSAIVIRSDAMYYDDGVSKVAPSSPQNGLIGKSDDTILGNACELKYRFYMKQSETSGGYLQFDLLFSYSYSA